MGERIKSYRDLIGYQKAHKVALRIYQLVKDFPQFETYGLGQQLRRASVSVLSNIAEGFMRGRKEYLQFLRMALGSCAEVEAQLLLSKDLGYLSETLYMEIDSKNREVINLLITYLKKLGKEL